MQKVPFPEFMTPKQAAEQAAEYLQVSLETVYRCTRQGKPVASRLDRSYLVPKRNLDLLLWESRTRQIPLRQYTREQVEASLREDELDAEQTQIAKRFLTSNDLTTRS